MGQADVRARTTSYQTGIREDAPVPGVSGITGVIEDRDLQLRLEGPSGEERVTGRWLPFRAPLAEGILTFTQSRPGSPELALRSEEHTSELQSRFDLVCRLLLEKKKRSTGDSRGATARTNWGTTRTRPAVARAGT